jgi:hypothetical protein
LFSAKWQGLSTIIRLYILKWSTTLRSTLKIYTYYWKKAVVYHWKDCMLSSLRAVEPVLFQLPNMVNTSKTSTEWVVAILVACSSQHFLAAKDKFRALDLLLAIFLNETSQLWCVKFHGGWCSKRHNILTSDDYILLYFNHKKSCILLVCSY